jgi:hypothetical protein
LWVAAFTGMRRNELLGLRWDDFDAAKVTLSINRGLVAIAYEGHETRGKTRNARRRVDLDPTTVGVLTACHEWQHAEQRAVGIEPAGWMLTPTSTCCPACKPTPPDCSNTSSPPCSTGRTQAGRSPGEAPEDQGLNTA